MPINGFFELLNLIYIKMDNNPDFADDYLSNEWKYLTNRLALSLDKGRQFLIVACLVGAFVS